MSEISPHNCSLAVGLVQRALGRSLPTGSSGRITRSPYFDSTLLREAQQPHSGHLYREKGFLRQRITLMWDVYPDS